MLLSELDKGVSVKLHITIDGKVFEFDSNVVLHHKQEVMFEPIRKNDKLLNVQSSNISVDILLLRPNEKPMIWRNAGMACVRYKREIYYAAKGDLDGREFNRRGEYRLFIGEEIYARIGNLLKEQLVILKDISNSGFAFIYEGELSQAEGAFVSMKYRARLEDKIYELPLYGRIVRKMPVSDEKMLYGCAMLKKNKMIGHYINQRQMEQLAGKNERFTNLNDSIEQ